MSGHLPLVCTSPDGSIQVSGGAHVTFEIAVVDSESDLDLPLVVDRDELVRDSGSGVLNLVLAPDGHVLGKEKILFIPPNTRSQVFVDPDLRVAGECTVDLGTGEITDWDPTVSHLIAILCVFDGEMFSTFRTGT